MENHRIQSRHPFLPNLHQKPLSPSKFNLTIVLQLQWSSFFHALPSWRREFLPSIHPVPAYGRLQVFEVSYTHFFFLISGCHIPICRRRRWEKISWQYKMVFLPIHLLQTVRFPSCSCLWGLCSTRIFGLSSYAWRNSFFCRMWDYILTKLKNISSSANPLSLWNQQSDIPCENEKHSGMKLLQHSWMKFLTPIIQFLNYAFTLKPKLCRRCHSTAPSQNQQSL